MVPASAKPRVSAPIRRAWWAITLALVPGCGDPATPPAGPTTPSGVVVSALPGRARQPAPAASGPRVDARALEELIANTPAPLPPTSASGTLVGTDSGLTGSEKPDVETDESPLVSLLPNLGASNAGSERDLRGTLYFDLVNQCRDANGAHLPPEAVEIELRIDAKGHIDRSSVRAKAERPEHAGAAACMARVARTSEALLTPPRLDKPISVRAKVPSVD